MTPSFDLVEEPWIPCVRPGNGVINLGLRQVFAEAAQLREIRSSSPLVTAALHRLLLALLHTIFGPADADAWIALWNKRAFDVKLLSKYLDEHRMQFDLFSETHPFYQVAGLATKDPWPAARLAQELAAKTDPTLFNHGFDTISSPLPAAQAAQYLVALQASALGGLVSYETKSDKSATAAPLANATLMLVRGANLFETLMLNLVCYSPEDDEPFPVSCEEGDRPAWERSEATCPIARRPCGYLDWLTWQSRRVLLRLDQSKWEADGTLEVPNVVVMKGYQLPAGVWRREFEQLVPFRKRQQAKPGEDPWPALQFRPERAVWRDSLALFQSADADAGVRPRAVSWLADVRRKDVDLPRVLSADLLGLASNRKSALLWRHEGFNFATAYVDDQQLVRTLEEALHLTKQVASLFLPGSWERMAEGKKTRIPRPLQLLAEAIVPRLGTAPPDQQAVDDFILALGIERRYWSRLDAPFRTFFHDLPEDTSVDKDGFTHYGRNAALVNWINAVRGAATQAFDEGIQAITTTGRGLKGEARAREAFTRGLNGMLSRQRLEWMDAVTTRQGGE